MLPGGPCWWIARIIRCGQQRRAAHGAGVSPGNEAGEQLFIFGYDLVPRITSLGAVESRLPQSRVDLRMVFSILEAPRQVLNIVYAIEDAGIGEHLGILRSAVGDNEVPLAHGFNQSGMRAADFGGVDVAERVRLELPVARAVDRAGQKNARVARLLQLPDVS